MPDSIKIRRALISVYDKTGVVDFARALHEEFGVEIISTGGTARTLKEAGIPVTMVEDVTGFPEMMDGRVKTLHPKIHAGILADRDNPAHMRQLKEQGIEPIDMVVVNLYPFEKTIAKPDCTFEEAIEMIDIGGPCLLRAAAKNHRHVLVLHDPEDWGHVLTWLREDALNREGWQAVSRGFATSTFRLVCAYNAAITDYLVRSKGGESDSFHAMLLRGWDKPRYGENPHQAAEVLRPGPPCESAPPHLFNVTPASVIASAGASVELSFNNYADASAALELCAELTRAGDVWHRLPAGGSTGRMPVPQESAAPASLDGVSPASQDRVAPASSRWTPVGEELQTRRNLPHIQKPGRTYFVTFRLRQGELPPAARDLALSACRFWDGKKMNLHIATVMPNHVHMLLTPYEDESGAVVPLGELLHSIKSYSANQINRLLGRSGTLWLDENWDRIMRNQREFEETWEYVETNAERAGLGRDYVWVSKGMAGFEESGLVHRQDAGATKTGEHSHRQDAGATQTSCAVCFIKHTNACGSAVDADPIEAYRKAYLGDPNAAMGGILAVNFHVDTEFATEVMETYQRWGKPLKDAGKPYAPGAFFVEVWLAPSFDEEAVRIIRGEVEGGPRKAWGQRVRLLDVGDLAVEPDPNEMDFKRIAGGVLMQDRDLLGLNEDQWQVVTERQPTEAEMNDLRLAWLVCKHTKSNAITVCKDGMLIGNGAGQMSRVMSCRIATWLAKENGHEAQLAGSVAASDAFFPFRDGPDILADAGVTAIIQPGGSKRDDDTIAACNERGLAMICTGTRHFKH